MALLGACNKYSKTFSEDGYLWQTMFRLRFPQSQLSPKAMKEWKLVYQLSLSKVVDRLRCFITNKTFFEDVLGVGIGFTVNPRTNNVDYISMSQDLLSKTAFEQHHIRSDAFGNSFQLFLPLYFTEEHFQRALTPIRHTIVKLASSSGRKSDPLEPFENVVLDVLPKIINTFVVLLSDQGISASHKSFIGLLRIHRLFLALAHHFPSIKRMAARRLSRFASDEKASYQRLVSKSWKHHSVAHGFGR